MLGKIVLLNSRINGCILIIYWKCNQRTHVVKTWVKTISTCYNKNVLFNKARYHLTRQSYILVVIIECLRQARQCYSCYFSNTSAKSRGNVLLITLSKCYWTYEHITKNGSHISPKFIPNNITHERNFNSICIDTTKLLMLFYPLKCKLSEVTQP